MNDSKTVLVTGGAKRIGAALVKSLHNRGMNVVLQYNQSADSAQKLIEQLSQVHEQSVVGVCADLEEFKSYQMLADSVYEHFGRLDVLINNAAGFFSTPVNEIKESHWDSLMNVNAKAPLFLTKNCSQMLKQTRGCVINITDIYADKPLGDYPIYCASKAALSNLTLSMAQALAPDIRVNAVAPGAILAQQSDNQPKVKEIVEKTPLKRMGCEQAIVDAALFLINNASFITGQIITVDGGRSSVAP